MISPLEKSLTPPCHLEYQQQDSKKIDNRGFCVQEINGYCASRCRQGGYLPGGRLSIDLQYENKLIRFQTDLFLRSVPQQLSI